MGMGIPSRGKRVCKGMEEQKGCTRPENFETVCVAGAWETQRNVEGGLGRWAMEFDCSCSNPSTTTLWLANPEQVTFLEDQVLCLYNEDTYLIWFERASV